MREKKFCTGKGDGLWHRRFVGGMVFLSLWLILATGCQLNRENTPQAQTIDAAQALQAVKETLDRSAFVYDGEVFWQDAGSSSTPAALVHGSAGPNRHLYVRLSVGQDAAQADDMDFYATPEAVYIRFAEDVAWQKADVPLEVVQGELQNWDPRAHLGRLFRLAESIRYVGGQTSDTLTVEAVLNPQAMRQELSQDIQNRTQWAGETMPPPTEAPPSPEQPSATFPKGVQWTPESASQSDKGVQGEGGRADQTRIIRQLSAGRKVDDRLSDTPPDRVPSSGIPALSGTYTVMFHAKTYEPIWIDYRERAVYEDEGQRYDDTTRYRFTFRTFGAFEGPPDTIGIEGKPQ